MTENYAPDAQQLLGHLANEPGQGDLLTQSTHGSYRLKAQKDFIISGSSSSKKPGAQMGQQNPETMHLATKNEVKIIRQKPTQPANSEFRVSAQFHDRDEKVEPLAAEDVKQKMKTALHHSSKVDGRPPFGAAHYPDHAVGPSPKARHLALDSSMQMSSGLTGQQVEMHTEKQIGGQATGLGIPAFQRLKSSGQLNSRSLPKGQKGQPGLQNVRGPTSSTLNNSKNDSALKQVTVMQGVGITGLLPTQGYSLASQLAKSKQSEQEYAAEQRQRLQQELVIKGSGGTQAGHPAGAALNYSLSLGRQTIKVGAEHQVRQSFPKGNGHEFASAGCRDRRFSTQSQLQETQSRMPRAVLSHERHGHEGQSYVAGHGAQAGQPLQSPYALPRGPDVPQTVPSGP